MNLFFDTLALVKYFHDEPGTKYVTALIEDADHTAWCSELAQIEFVSAVHRKFREGVLDEEQLRQALDGFAEAAHSFYVEPLGQPVTEEAGRLLQKHGRVHALRTLDALHLATYTLISEPEWRFVVADDRLYDLARKEQHAAIHPLRRAVDE